ncbi:MAG: type 4a pilus biogenesis protein PilO [Parcubacteria group bacterium]|nr:type 4a pilus biogenesis protein PilO [Parcubacteria group bacterium]
MKASSKRIFSILGSGVLFITALVIYALFIRPEYDNVQRLRSEVASRSQAVEQQKDVIKQIQRLLQEYQSVARLQETLSLALPQESDVAEALNQLNGAAQIGGLAIQSAAVQSLAIRPSSAPIKSAKGIGTLRFNTKISGDYEQIKRFLQMLETNVRLMDVKSLKIESGVDPTQKSAQKYLYNITVDVYYQAK